METGPKSQCLVGWNMCVFCCLKRAKSSLRDAHRAFICSNTDQGTKARPQAQPKARLCLYLFSSVRQLVEVFFKREFSRGNVSGLSIPSAKSFSGMKAGMSPSSEPFTLMERQRNQRRWAAKPAHQARGWGSCTAYGATIRSSKLDRHQVLQGTGAVFPVLPISSIAQPCLE